MGIKPQTQPRKVCSPDEDIMEVYADSVGCFDYQVTAWDSTNVKYVGKCVVKRDWQGSSYDYSAMVLGFR